MIKTIIRKASEKAAIKEWCRENLGPEGYRWWFNYDDGRHCIVAFEVEGDQQKFLTMFWMKWPGD